MSEIRRYDVAVLGGGAAGLCAAIAAARVGARVVVVEREQRLGQKILATGNGRCNLSNATIGAAGATAEAGAATAAMIDAAAVAGGAGAAAAYNHPDFVKPLLEAFPFAVIRAFFEELGLLLVVEDNGWAYPRSRRANSVLGVLLNALEVPGVEVLTAYRAGLEVLSGGGYRLFNEDADAQRSKDDIGLSRGNNSSGAPAGGNDDIIARAVVIASGRPPQTRGLKALRLREPVAVLGPLGVSPAQIKGLDGVRTQCRVSLIRRGAPAPIVAESGELLFRKKAVSGIVIFNLSRWARPGDRLSIDLFSEYTHLQLESLLIRLHQHLPASLAADDFLVGLLHRRLALTVLRLSGVNPNLPFVRERILRTAEVAKDLRLTVTSGPSAEQAQLTRGGFACDCFDPLTLQAHSHPGLFVAGECLDIDGPCGGYNLHWAWASGLAAGVGAATAAGVAAPSIPAFATHAAFAGTNTNVATVRAAPSRVS